MAQDGKREDERETRVHPTAIVDAGASIGEGVVIGPYAVVGDGVTVGDGCTIGSHSCLEGPMTLGPRCWLGRHVVLGTPPQDRTYQGEATRLEIGEGCWFGDGANANRGTVKGGGLTRIGARCMLMAGAHVGHDCRLGDGVSLINNAMLAGHCEIGDGANISGGVAVHQFVRVGRLTMAQGNAAIAQDAPPFAWVGGCRARIQGVNRVGMMRSGVDRAGVDAIRAAYRRLFRAGDPLSKAIDALAAELPDGAAGALVEELLRFCREAKRGVCAWKRT